MTPATNLRRGWCPGVLRPMRSGDGLIVRVKPSGGSLTMHQARALASLAAAHGNGIVELTSRGNLQLRGITTDALATLTAALDQLRLLDASPEAEAIRNIISSPLAGVDPTAYDTRAIVRALEQALLDAVDLAGLSDKFGFLVDGGGALALADIDADVRFVHDGQGFSVGLGGGDSGTLWIGACRPDAVADVAIALARSFKTIAHGARRMRSLSPTDRSAVAAEAAGLLSPSEREPPAAAPQTFQIGVLSFAEITRAAAIGLPFGASTAEALLKLIDLAQALGMTELRLTPWRGLIFVASDAAAATQLIVRARQLGFVTRQHDPRRSVAACPGAPACEKGSTPVREDAAHFADAIADLPRDVTLHVSGCAKGCACRRPTAITLVAEAGRYGLVVNGTAADAPQRRFTPEQATEMLARLASAVTKAGDAPDARTAAVAATLKEIAAA